MRSICRTLRFALLALAYFAVSSAAVRAQSVDGGDPASALRFQSASDRPAVRGSVPASRFEEADEIATLEAIRLALTEVGDGGSYAWYRENGNLNGIVSPTASFKDRQGRICRHIIVILSAGPQTGKVEGIACRTPDGRWVLEG